MCALHATMDADLRQSCEEAFCRVARPLARHMLMATAIGTITAASHVAKGLQGLCVSVQASQTHAHLRQSREEASCRVARPLARHTLMATGIYAARHSCLTAAKRA